MRSTNRSSSNQSSLFFNHLIDAGKQKPALIKWEPVRIDQGESTKAVRTYVRPNSNFKRSQGPKTQKKRFSKNPIKRPRICRSRYKICKNLGTFIRTSQNWLFALDLPKTQDFKNPKITKIKNPENVKKHLFSSNLICSWRLSPL